MSKPKKETNAPDIFKPLSKEYERSYKEYDKLLHQKPKRNTNATKITISLSKEYMDYYKELNKLLNEKTQKEWTLSQTIRLVLERESDSSPSLITDWIKMRLENKKSK